MITADIDAVTLKALAKDPADRYQSAREMKADLTRVLAGQQATEAIVASAAAKTVDDLGTYEFEVIVSDGDHLAMESTLAKALQVVFGELPSIPKETTVAPQAPTSGPREALSEAEQALRRGDWTAFGYAWERLKSLLER